MYIYIIYIILYVVQVCTVHAGGLAAIHPVPLTHPLEVDLELIISLFSYMLVSIQILCGLNR